MLNTISVLRGVMEDIEVGRGETARTKTTVIQSLERGLNILELVARDGAGISMAEVSRRIGLHASTTFHLLRTLSSLGYLVQDEVTRKYYVGSKVFQLVASAWSEAQLIKTSEQFLTELTELTAETSHLGIFDHGEVIVVHKVEGGSNVRVSERVGYPRPAHCTAIGKTLLAYLTESDLKAFLGKHELCSFTPKTITAAALLEQELKRVRDQGYGFDDEEHFQGIRCLAAPVRNFTGAVVAAVGISGPLWRVSLDRVTQLTESVKTTGERLSRQLGYLGKDKSENLEKV